MNEPITPKRWALQWPALPHPNAAPEVRGFHTDYERAAWVAQNPRPREAVGVNNPHVKAYRTSKANQASIPKYEAER